MTALADPLTIPRVALSVREAAASLGVSEDTVRKLVDEGELRRVPHVGRRILIPFRSLEEFANSQGGES